MKAYNFIKGISGYSEKRIKNGLKNKMMEYFHIDEEVTDYYFEVKAEKAGGSTWFYYVGGAVIAGGVAALLLVGGEENGEVTQTAIKPPPIRP